MPRLKKKSYLQKQSSNKDAMRASRDAHQHNDGLNFPKKCGGLNFPKKCDGLNFPKKSENGLNFPKKSENGLNFPKKSEGSLEVSKACQKNSESLLKDFKSFAEELQKELPDDLPSASCVHMVPPESFTGYVLSSSQASVAMNNIIHDSTNPFQFVSLMYGSFHQGDERFSWGSRGSQCTINSLCALIFSQYFEFSSRESLDDILTAGDQLYKNVVRNLRQLGNFKHRLLCLDEMPDEVNIKCKKIHIEKGNIVSGNAVTQFGSSVLPALHQSLYNVLQSANHVLIMIGAICSAVFFKDGLYWFFDSHSHGSDGLSHPDGRSVLISFSCLDNLVSYMYALYNSMSIDLLSQYELMPLKFSFLISDELLMAEYFQDQKQKSECKKNESVRRTDADSSMEEWKVVKRRKINKTEIKNSHDNVNMTTNTVFEQGKKDRRGYLRKYKQTQRHDPKFRKAEKEKDKAAKQKIRLDEQVKNEERVAKKFTRVDIDYRQAEKDRDKAARQKIRLSEQVKNKERVAKKLTREDIDYRQAEKDRDKAARQKIRLNEQVKNKERVAKKLTREDIDYRQAEKNRDREARQTSRLNEHVKNKERMAKKLTREDIDYRQAEKDRDKAARQKSRQDIDYRQAENERDKAARQKSRQDIDYRQAENERDKAAKQNSRLHEEVKNKERVAKKFTRDDIDYRQAENERNREAKRLLRKNDYVLEKERISKHEYRRKKQTKDRERVLDRNRKASKRKEPDYRESEIQNAKQRKYGNSVDDCIRLFHRSIETGPQYICSCCQQTWFKESVSVISSCKNIVFKKYLTGKKSVDNKEWICITCKASILNKRVPKLSVLNGMKWPQKPEELELYPLEERLIALRIPFMQLRELPRGRQYSLKGNVINVPVEIQPVVDVLPRPLDENVTVPVKLKKKLSHKSCAFTENIRPLRVLVALHWLLRHSKLYANANVQIDEQWIEQVTQHSNEVLQEFLSADTESHSENSHINIAHEEKEQGIEQKESELYDSDEEENIHLQENVGNIDTLVDYENLENRSNVLTFAPGENQRPLSIYQDKDSEYLCFPTIFCGQTRQENEERLVSVHYSDIAKWELRHFDRRAANSLPNIFFKLKKIQMKQLNDKVNLAVRRCQIDGRNITASQARDVHCTEEIVKKDQGYYIFKQLRNSPAYLETKKKDVFAMLRQLGMPTWFLSLSSADTRWSDLLKMLASLNSDVEYTDNDIRNLSWEQKVKLIQKDPVTCSRYFDHRVQQFIKLVLKSTHNPLGVISDYFYRVEFQQRGSPHIHMIAWVQNSPKYNECNVSEITAYVDQYLKCSSDNADMTDLIQLQIHQHSRSCKKKDVRKCRFGFPLPPLPETMVLEPLESDVEKYKKLYEKIQEKMNKEKNGFDMSYKHFLTDIVQLSEQDYIKCIRSTLNTPKVFLKREPKDIRLNLYNETVLRAWKANIDIQFILDPYACAMYIVSYISKSQRGMSSLMHAACKEARNGNLDLKRQVRHVGNVFSNSVEVSAQEAVYLVLQMSLTRSTRDVTFINTSTPEKRIHLLKSKTVLDEMPDNSTDVIAENAIKRYSKRPKKLENWCLADYVSKLDIVFPKNEHLSDSVENVNDDNESDDDGLNLENLNDSQTICYFKNGGQIRIRKNARVIRYVRYNLKSDEENHFREKLLLFLPWRNEVLDLLANYESFKDHYLAVKAKIDCKCMEYEHHADQIEIAREMAEVDEEMFDEIAPGTQQTEVDTAAEEVVESEAFVYFNPDRVAEHRHYDIGIELGSGCSNARVESNEILLPEEEYLELLRCLNTNQRRFYNHVIHWIKTKTEPLYAYLSGGAGVGKSVVIKAIFQTLYRFLNLKEGQNSDETRILLCAFTGKAAFNINGSTIAKAFFEGYMQSNQQLTCERLNTFRSKYRELSVIIIDEISMVSKIKLSFIDQRLQQLTGTNKAFGGLSIIAVGDLYQLQPVTGGWIFKDLDRGASALSRNLWKDHFRMYELTEIMRQKDDISFAELLNRLRHNTLTDVDRAELKKREVKQYSEQHPLHAPHIFAESTFMNLHNQEIIRRKQAQHITVTSLDVVMSPKLSKDKQEKTLRSLPDDHNKTGMLFRLLPIVVDMVYDLTVNLNTADGLTNGASCRIQFVEYRQVQTDRPSIIWVLFDDPKVGTEQRQKYRNRGFYSSQIHDSWTPVFDVDRTFSYNRKTIQRIQFPLQPAAGRTVHRTQGCTLNEVVVDLSQRTVRKWAHIHYVALSRVRSLQNLYILNFNEKALKVDEDVVVEMDRLQRSAKLELCYTPLDTVDSSLHFKIIYNNCRSLHKHFEHVKADQNVLSAHIIGLAETRLCQTDHVDEYAIEGFHLLRNDQQTGMHARRPSHGLALYIHDDVNVCSSHSFSSTHFEFIVVSVKHILQSMQVAVVYKAPRLSYQHLIQTMENELLQHLDRNKPLLITGDFNIDVFQDSHTNLETFMFQRLGCTQLVEEQTTDNGSALDLIFTNCSGNSGTIETYWSDHKLVYFHT